MQQSALTPLDTWQQRRHKYRNLFHSLLLLGGMALLLAACGWIVAGVPGIFMTVVLGGFGLLLSPRLSPRLVLRLFGANELPEEELADIYRIVDELSRRAGLERRPRLFYIASPSLNALSVGQRNDAAIAMTTGLLSRLSLRELAGVLAHELSHIRNNDMWVMGLADMATRLTRAMSLVGIMLLIVNAPLFLAGMQQIPWVLVLLLIFAPSIGTLLQLALSRTREFDADLDAAGLTRDPAGLAAALRKLERYQGRSWESIFLPGRRSPEPSVLRTHPLTEARVQRLLELRTEAPFPSPDQPSGVERYRTLFAATPPLPRWRRSMWY